MTHDHYVFALRICFANLYSWYPIKIFQLERVTHGELLRSPALAFSGVQVTPRTQRNSSQGMGGYPTLRQQNYPGARGKNLVSTELYAD